MYTRPDITKASITNLDDSAPKSPAKGLKEIKFPFNPKKISIKRGESFKAQAGKVGSDWTGLSWSGAGADELSMEFVIDTTEPEITLENPAAAVAQVHVRLAEHGERVRETTDPAKEIERAVRQLYP